MLLFLLLKAVESPECVKEFKDGLLLCKERCVYICFFFSFFFFFCVYEVRGAHKCT